MKKTACFILFSCIISFGINAQDLYLTFTGVGESSVIDSVTALNGRTDQSITFPGDATLVLSRSSGIQDISQLTEEIMVYPNPFSGASRVVVNIQEPQIVNLRIQKLTGQIVAQSAENIQAGVNEFKLSLIESGLYFLVAEILKDRYSCKLVNLTANGHTNEIQYAGLNGIMKLQSGSSGLKNSQSGYSIEFMDGDLIHYTCFSGVMTTVVNDFPVESKNYVVEFADCTDPDGRRYRTVSIGEQLWMEENLAYLPSITISNRPDFPAIETSDSIPCYYVYDYQGSSVSEAELHANYTTYGVLYNWPAAMKACPEGWHLPSDAEWTVLTDYLINNGYGYQGSGEDIGKSMAATSGWDYCPDRGTVGNFQIANNSSGFNVLPCGFLYDNEDIPLPVPLFWNEGSDASFWTSTEDGQWTAWSRNLEWCKYGVDRSNTGRRWFGFSVRCLKNK
jgi:uncharacterized protein (TIGR02145 family)